MQQTRTVLQHDGPNHLGLWFTSGAKGPSPRARNIGTVLRSLRGASDTTAVLRYPQSDTAAVRRSLRSAADGGGRAVHNNPNSPRGAQIVANPNVAWQQGVMSQLATARTRGSRLGMVEALSPRRKAAPVIPPPQRGGLLHQLLAHVWTDEQPGARRAGESLLLTAAVPVDNPYRGCKLTRKVLSLCPTGRLRDIQVTPPTTPQSACIFCLSTWRRSDSRRCRRWWWRWLPVPRSCGARS